MKILAEVVPSLSDPATHADKVSARHAVAEDQKAYVHFSWRVWGATSLLAGWGALSANPLLTPVAIVVLVGCAQLLWRRGEPPVLVFACFMQWLQAAGVIFYSDYHGVSITQASGSFEFELATWLSLLAIPVLALGMRFALIRCKTSQNLALRAEGLRVDVVKAFILYLLGFGIAVGAAVVAFTIPALTQLIYALITVKWMAVFVLAYCVLEQRKGYAFLTFAVLVEFGFGFLGYFSAFKSVFFVLLVAALTSPLALRGRRLLLTAMIAVVLFSTGIVWTAIKQEYRGFLNQGSEQQIVAVSMEESVGKLGELLSNLSWDGVQEGLDGLVLRVSYTKFFALTIINVPNSMPFEHGALWLGALKHVVTPRLFFPEKAALSDSDRTSLYTGVQVTGDEQGTSIGIGYVAESYIDFGPIFMFVPIFLLGLFYGLIYRIFAIHSHHRLIGTSIATSILIFGAYTIETSNIKLVGGNFTAVLVMGILYKVFGKPLKAWLEY
jgi:hypothetical protein